MIDYNQMALEYARHRQVHPEVIKGLFSTGQLGNTARVLEVGCGTGNYIITLTVLAGCSGWGVEPSTQMLAKAREQLTRAGEQSEEIKFKIGQAENLDFPPDFFDLVFSVDVIHHVAHHLDYFKTAYRALKAGGKLCTATDSEWIIRHRQPLTHYFPESAEVDLKRYPAIAQLRQLMAQVGFSQISEHTVEFAYQLTDIQMYRAKAYSVLHLISEEAFQKGIEAMERDLSRRPIQGLSHYLLIWGAK